MKRLFHISLRLLRALFLGILLLIVGIAIFINSNFFDSILRSQLQSRLGKAINRPVHADRVVFNPFKLSFTLRNFSIGNDSRGPEEPFFTVHELYANLSWSDLIAGKIRVDRLRLVRPELNLVFYKEGGDNWPHTKPKAPSKKGGVNFTIGQVDCEEMAVSFNRKRQPTINFDVQNLQAFVEHDDRLSNYVATTHFRNGRFKIKNFEFWHFDLEAKYRILSGGHISFERLFFLSPRTKFYMGGEMYIHKDPIFNFRFRSRINLDETRQIFHFAPEMSGNGNFHAKFDGTLPDFRMKGAGEFRDFTFYALPIDRATFDLDMTGDWLNVTNIQANMFDGGYSGDFSINPLHGRQIFKTSAVFKRWDGKLLGRFVHMNNMIIPIKGSGEAKIQWAESVKDMTGDFHFVMEPYEDAPVDLPTEAERTSFDNTLYSRPFVLPARNDMRFRIEHRAITNLITHLELPYTAADITGSIDFSGAANLNIETRSQKISELDLLFHHLQSYFTNKPIREQEFWEARGAADFSGKLDATVWTPFEPRINGHVIGRNVLYHGVHLSEVRADVQLYKKLIDVFHADIFYGKATGEAQAKFFLEDKKTGQRDGVETTASVKNYPIYEIPHAFNLELPVHGTVNATIQLKGPFHNLEGRTDFEAFQGDLWGQQWKHATGTVLFFPDSLGLRDIRAQMDDTGLAEASGDLVYDSDEFTVEFSGQNLALEKLNLLKDSGLNITGSVSGTGSGHGTFLKPQLEGKFNFVNLHYNNELYGDISSNVHLEQDLLSLQATGVARGIPSNVEATVRLDGKLPVEAKFDIEKFPLEILTRAYAPGTSNVTGLIGGKFTLTGTLYPAEITNVSGALDNIQLKAYGVHLASVRPLNVVLSENVIQIKDSLLQGPSTKLSLTGSIYPKDKGRLDLNLSAEMGLDALSNWQKDINASGTATAKISITGNFRQPELTGVMEIQNGFFRHYSFPNSLTEIAALVTFKNRNISLQSFHANSSGGKLTAGGTATLKGYSLDTYRFDVYADKIRVHYPEGLRSTVNAELHLQTQREASYLTGDIDVLQGVYSSSFEESPSVFGYARVPAFAGLTVAAGASASPATELRLNIRIHSDGRLLVRNNFANITSSANLNLTGTIDDPVLVGRIEVNKGAITFQNREYNVVRGSLDFSNPYRTDPLLNFVAEARIREYRLTLTFSGTFDRIYHDITSDPPLSRDDIYALLGVGYTRNEVSPGSYDISTLLAGQEITQFIASPIASPLEKGFRRVFGLQRFTINPTYVQSTQVATARITLQKDISKDFSITYSTNLFSAAEEFVLLQYQVTDEIQITASKDEQARYGIDVLVTKTFE